MVDDMGVEPMFDLASQDRPRARKLVDPTGVEPVYLSDRITHEMAPEAGLAPAPSRLTAERATLTLLWNKSFSITALRFSKLPHKSESNGNPRTRM